MKAHETVKLFHGDRPQTYEESISQLRLSFGMALDLSTMYEGRAVTKKHTKKSDKPQVSDAFTQGSMPILQLLSRRRPQYDIPENEKTGLQDIELALSGINSDPSQRRATDSGGQTSKPSRAVPALRPYCQKDACEVSKGFAKAGRGRAAERIIRLRRIGATLLGAARWHEGRNERR